MRTLTFQDIVRKSPDSTASLLTLSARYFNRGSSVQQIDQECYAIKNSALELFSVEDLPYKIEVRFPRTYRHRYLLWIETRCKGRWSFYLKRWTTSDGGNVRDSMYVFSFENPAEAAMFKLQVPQGEPS